MAIRAPSFRLVRDGTTLPESAFTKTARTGSRPVGGLADPIKIYREFEAGATIVLQGAHRFWLPLARFCRDLERELGHPTQVNAYITPPGSRGLAVHRDEHDVFVLQSFGTKRWQVFDRTDTAGSGPPALETEMQPGDALYVPRGFPHAASTQTTASVHLTVGILSVTWGDATEEILRMARAPWEPLPMRFADDPVKLEASIRERLQELRARIGEVDPAEIAGRLRRRFFTTRQPLLTGQLQQVLALPSLGDGSLVRRRPGSFCEIVVEGDELSVLLGDRELRMPAWVEPAVRMLAEAGEGGVAVRELGPYLDADGRLVLARRLAREGLLEVAW